MLLAPACGARAAHGRHSPPGSRAARVPQAMRSAISRYQAGPDARPSRSRAASARRRTRGPAPAYIGWRTISWRPVLTAVCPRSSLDPHDRGLSRSRRSTSDRDSLLGAEGGQRSRGGGPPSAYGPSTPNGHKGELARPEVARSATLWNSAAHRLSHACGTARHVRSPDLVKFQ
jgi:hypothetical protein